MKQLSISAIRYQSELISSGITEESIAEIETLCKQLSIANEQQEDFKKQRVLLTQNRNILYNEVWDYVRQIARIGKIIFEDNPAKYSMYLISDDKPVRSSVITSNGPVGAESKIIIQEDKFDETTRFLLRNTANVNLEFYTASNSESPVPENPLIVESGNETTVMAYSLGEPGSTFLMVYNPSPDTVGEYFLRRIND